MSNNIPPKVQLKLVGLNGNAFFVMGAFSQAAKKQGWTKDQINAVIEEAKAGDYDHLLRTFMKYTESPDEEPGDCSDGNGLD
jgi:hypothetical protein